MLRTDYRDFIDSDEWANTRARYYRSRRPQHCFVCGAKQFQLHHITYDDLGREHLNDLVPLCDRHHGALHRYARKHRNLTLRQATVQYLARARLLA